MKTREIVHPMFGIKATIIERESWLPATPSGWTWIEQPTQDGAWYRHRCSSGYLLMVGLSAAIEQDGVPWLHLSLSKRSPNGKLRAGLLPSWEEVKYAKDSFIGRDKEAIQVLPPESSYVNIFDVLHLWHRLDGTRAVPDFSWGTGSI